MESTGNSIVCTRLRDSAMEQFSRSLHTPCSRKTPLRFWPDFQVFGLRVGPDGSRAERKNRQAFEWMRIVTFGIAFVLLATTQSHAEDYTLSTEDIAFLNQIDKSDRFFSELGRGADGMAALNKVLGLVASGPVKISIAWNKGAIEGWKKANAKLVKLNQQLVCLDIQAHLLDTENTEFFEQLASARGCDL